jgi:predicted alpha/beta hydrolase family esterase
MRIQESSRQTEERTGHARGLLTETSVLMIPGWNGSGAAHWQTLWEQKYSHFRRVQQGNWSHPSRTDWVNQITIEVARIEKQTFLVAHSLGCLAVAHWATLAPEAAAGVAGAFLVAPPWIAKSDQCPRELLNFLPMPLEHLPFPSMFVASEDDHYLPIEIAGRLASAWGSQFVNVGRQGHINVASGHGPWQFGEELLQGFVDQIFRSHNSKNKKPEGRIGMAARAVS